jgi:hypothetical protein
MVAASWPKDPAGSKAMSIDDQMPRWERRFWTCLPVAAPADRTFAAIRHVDFFRSPVIGVPNRARQRLDALVGSPARTAGRPPKRFGFEQLLEEEGGFRLLSDDGHREIVLGFIGRWWERGYGRVAWAPDELRDFDRPECAVGVWGFSALPYGADASVLVTDVRVRCTDDEARRKFRRYWMLVGPFVTAMGKPVLRLVRDQAERTPGTATG